ncbi:MAG: PilZ domain-containing protein [Armatimonadetes bacterium]|nr:PilZ domain-containing protein [Armatimonadota bacterium]
MQGAFSGPQVSYLEHSGELVTFLSPASYPAGSVQRVQLKLPGCHGNASIGFSLRIRTSRPALNDRFVCLGQMMEGAARLGSVGPAAPVCDPFLRGSSRVPHRARVVCSQPHPFASFSVDCSAGGLQLEAQEELPIGAVLDLTLDLEPAVERRARVVWCRTVASSCRAGLAFFEPVALGLGQEVPGAVAPVAGVVEGFQVDEDAHLWVRIEGVVYSMRFSRPRLVRDERALVGREFADAVEVEPSPLVGRFTGPQPLTHYQLIGARGEVLLEVVCEGAVEQRREREAPRPAQSQVPFLALSTAMSIRN